MPILNYNIYFFSNGKVINNRLRESHIINKFPIEYYNVIEYCNVNNLNDIVFSRKLWHYLKDVKEIPNSKWKGFRLGYNNNTDYIGNLTINNFYTNNKTDSNKVRESYVKKHYNNHYNLILSYTDLDIKFVQKIWHYINDKTSVPSCKTCGAETKWKNLKEGYRKYCSRKCSSLSNETKEAKKKTINSLYGVDYITQSDIIKDKRKCKLQDLYGEDHVMKIDKFKDKRKSTIKERYGVDYISQSDIIKDKIRKGITKYYNSTKYLDNKKLKHIDNLNDNGLILERFLDTDTVEVTCKKCKKTHNTSFSFINQRLYKYNVTLCKYCLPKVKAFSNGEKELLDFIKNNYSGTIIENDRTLLKNKELDIYIPYLKLAFEFNGNYWHNEIYKDKKYHLNKTNECLNNQTRLIHIYEDDWVYKQEIVKSRIKNILGKSKKVYARKCTIKEINNTESKEFLNKNHIQKNSVSKVKIGLYHDNELIALMTFGSLRKNLGQTSKEGSFELLRFCNKLNYSVVGGASRLLKYFIRNYYPNEIISYADKSWSNGRLYENLGFENIGETGPNYYYVVNNIRENRYKYRKSELVKDGYDENMTEHSIMISRKIYRIYDSGSFKFKLILNK